MTLQIPAKLARAAVASLGACALAIAAAPVAAQTDDAIDAELEALVDAGLSPDAAIASARQQIAANDLTGAASTLERALLEDRNAHDVRALYATVLCRLDDPQGAQIEVGLLKGQEIDPTLSRDLVANCGLTPGALDAASPAAATNDFLRGGVMLGLQFDSDIVGAMGLQTINPFFPAPAFTDQGIGFLASGDLEARSPLGDGWAYATFDVDVRLELDGPPLPQGDYSYQIGKLRFGYGKTGANSEFSIGPAVRYSRLFGESFATEIGGDARLTLRQEDNRDIIFNAEVMYEDFTAVGTGSPGFAAFIPGYAELRDGFHFDLSAASLKREDDGDYGFFGAGVEYKDADLRGFWAARLFGAARQTISENGHYVSMTGVYRYVDFESRRAPLFPVALPRNDHRVYFRGALGLPLGNDGNNSYVLETGASLTARWSSAASQLFDYDSIGLDVRFIWRFQ